ncbi:MAG TPA: hypothetical protein VML19_02550 [Verrucomicrobiae bacterium]|nr:hypothetical protein [Verrucomicrobiae bacterium]
MPGSMEFLRWVLGAIGVGCAFMAARAFVLTRKGLLRGSRTTGWLIRTVLCLGGVMFRHSVDVLVITVWVLMIAAAVAGWWVHSRPQTQEDLTHTIFPDGQ